MGLYLREVFPTLEDSVSGFGVCLTRSQVGDSPAGRNGAIGFAFRDSAGNLVLPQLDSSGRLPVSTIDGNALTGNGTIANGTTSGMTIVPGTTLVLTSGKTYTDLGMSVSCSRTAQFQMIQNNNGSLSTICDVIVGPGQYSFAPYLKNLSVTAGVTGTQQLYIQGVCLDKASALIATVVATQAN